MEFVLRKSVRKFLVFLVAFWLLSQVSSVAAKAEPGIGLYQANNLNATLQDVIGAVSGENLIRYVADTSQFSRCIWDAGHNQAVDYFVKTLSDMGYKPQTQPFTSSAAGTRGTRMQNVVARKSGTNPQAVHIIGAHYDSTSNRIFPPVCDGLATGANDNASGVAAVLEIARLLNRGQFRDDIELVLWDAEEFGYLGSQHYVQQYKATTANLPVGAVINLDMIGYPVDGGASRTVYMVAQPGDSLALAREGLDLTTRYLPGVKYQPYTIGEAFPANRDPNRNSDHRSFWETNLGTAIYLNEDALDTLSGDPRWHTPNDTLFQRDGSLRFDTKTFADATRVALLITGSKAVPQPRRFFSNLEPRFEQAWAKADRPVLVGVETGQGVGRGYTWGAQPFQIRQEPYSEAAGGIREVAYFDKARMELTNNSANPVTNGLLVREMSAGQVQLGDSRFEAKLPSQVPVAGDPNESNQNPSAPTYASFKAIIERGGVASNTNPVTATLSKNGLMGNDAGQGALARNVFFVRETGHNIPDVFFNWFSLQGRIFDSATGSYGNGLVFDWVSTIGLPVTEAFWVATKVGGEDKRVLVQLFERRVLTYTPSNPSAFQVEMGNVGQHYYKWRYS
jgi:Peptidase family M28